MYMLIAIAVTVLVIALAWRGIGAGASGDESSQTPTVRPARPRSRTVAPDDDPEFLREIDRKLRGGEDKS
ncbi:hypothetical protein ABIB25_005544 [Nakamurella sp. UYEF19]|uniref:hypothetical protein n=1 Tax=Nakamurella sp. UYEF19 TaxID=1756392 RepID=UPI0033986E61